MSPSLNALFCLGLCLGQGLQAQIGPLPKPSLQALPSALVPLETPVTIRCRGPPGVDLYRLEKLKPRDYKDEDVLYISAMKRHNAGEYRCSYQNGSLWSPASELLELVATGVYEKPTLSVKPRLVVSPGEDVTLQCQSRYGFDQYALYKKGDAGPHKRPQETWYRASFPIMVTAAHSGSYQCYSFSSKSPYLWSAPSDPLELVVTGTSGTSSLLPTEAPSSATGTSGTPSRLPTEAPSSATGTSGTPSRLPTEAPSSATETSKTTTIVIKNPDPTTGLIHQSYMKENLARICLGAVILMLLVGFLVEDWHSRKKSPLYRLRAVHRPLPPLPPTQKAHGRQDGS
ncbi:platelet glycoprotein VI isoform X2 [Molossus molossus]|uniref:Glycoprotein VI platelet n=1 Tax=Molossus molossus TaxID=27622 RepID=A0A7J8C7G3_MOLMO|nr:platelet glycoprotein VI isoform X2 [Molossus molossus]KAF6406835.1 glycoprotein VI platelet [Molossus molossus]